MGTWLKLSQSALLGLFKFLPRGENLLSSDHKTKDILVRAALYLTIWTSSFQPTKLMCQNKQRTNREGQRGSSKDSGSKSNLPPDQLHAAHWSVKSLLLLKQDWIAFLSIVVIHTQSKSIKQNFKIIVLQKGANKHKNRKRSIISTLHHPASQLLIFWFSCFICLSLYPFCFLEIF